jgi:RNA polymerase sigma-70 factor (ECF subfamily)
MDGSAANPRPALTEGPELLALGAAAPPSGAAEAPRSLDEFLAGVERRAFRVAELGLGHREDALDAVQEAMIRLLRYRERPGQEWSPLFWGILRRQIADRHRRNAVRRRVMTWLGRKEEDAPDPLELLPDPGADPLRRLQDDRAWRAMGAAVRMLPRRQRESWLLRELQGLDVAETAAAMGCSEGSVKTHLSRAMQSLRRELEEWR